MIQTLLQQWQQSMKHRLLNQERSSPQSHSILFTSAISALRNYLRHGGDSRVTRREKQHGEKVAKSS